MKQYVGIFFIALAGAVIGTGLVQMLSKKDNLYQTSTQNIQLARTSSTGATKIEFPDFIGASSMTTPAVVHIKSTVDKSAAASNYFDPFRQFFGEDFDMRMPSQQSSGSGVIVERDGYIITNNHVIDGATLIEVILNDKRSYEAELIGRDPTTDIALLKINETELPTVPLGNSDKVQVGEWVLAVGNPFNLTSTVTAGIVSAKGRSLNILDEAYRIESFIQTDAAVNPGNSGGALINNLGELVGINTAIASQTGSFSGYSFAVPVNLVKKVIRDLKEFGKVQRGVIGVQIRDIDARLAEEENLPVLNGALVTGIFKDGAADIAGIEEGDIISKINGNAIKTSSELQEIVGRYRPGEELEVEVIRDEERKSFDLKLMNMEGSTKLLKADNSSKVMSLFGADLSGLSDSEKESLELDYGVKIQSISDGLFSEIGLEEGFIITRINKKQVHTPTEVRDILKSAGSRVSIEATDETGSKMYFNFSR